MENQSKIQFTGFYGQADPNVKNHSWDTIKRISRMVKEDWIVGGDFNAIMDDAEKMRTRRKPRMQIDEFREVLEELPLVDIKTTRGWFAWINNRDGNKLVKKRLDRFVMAANTFSVFPFIEANVIRHTKSDHDVVLLDTLVRKPKEKQKDPRLSFKFNACWANDKRANEIIKNV
ncbi:hypothetical protein PVK06_017601 [Gossypium arboreum]|uniref:Endonuclease/exonuclease/phosphatase domain-containing protein n=1 Tax=Gossypium arboreum TaxID=29729 RepID=A0ABR0Q3W4_GOSAR|nr:hypothetical protein PVK06_017601 [Gossypium arboreum]